MNWNENILHYFFLYWCDFLKFYVLNVFLSSQNNWFTFENCTSLKFSIYNYKNEYKLEILKIIFNIIVSSIIYKRLFICIF